MYSHQSISEDKQDNAICQSVKIKSQSWGKKSSSRNGLLCNKENLKKNQSAGQRLKVFKLDKSKIGL